MLANIQLEGLTFSSDTNIAEVAISSPETSLTGCAADTSLIVLFELQNDLSRNQSIDSQPVQSNEPHYKFDFSATNLPLKPKKFSIFKASPLLSFYEITTIVNETDKKKKKPKILFESDVSKIESTDPFWTLTHPIPHSHLSPLFRVNMY